MKTNIFRKFLKNTQGLGAMALALGLVPTALIGFGALEYTEYSTIMTRTAQGQMQALYAVSQEGPEYMSLDGKRQSAAWMDVNLEALGRVSASFTHDIEMGSTEAVLKTSFSDVGFLGVLPETASNVSQEIVAEYYYKPIEVAFALDGSASYKNNGDIVQAAVQAGVNNLFEGVSTSDSVWVSMVFSAGFTNIGTSYVDGLVNPASVAPYYDMDTLTTPGTGYMDDARVAVIEELAEKTKTMLNTYYGSYASDLMQPGAPGYDVDILCVNSPQLGEVFYNVNLSATEQELKDYVNTAFEAPEETGIWFDLVKGEAWPITGAGTIRLPKNGVLYATAAAGAYMTDSNSRSSVCVGYEGVTLEQVAFLNLDPDGSYYSKIIDVLNNTTKASSYTTWGTDTGLKAQYTEPMVTVPGGCPRPAMIVGSNSADEIVERAGMWGTATSSRTDESIAWGLRMLSPGYSNVWNKRNYPAEFEVDGGEREKRLIVMFDTDIGTSGYGSSNWGGFDVISPMCEAAKEKGIDIYMIQVGTIDSIDEQIAANCADDDHRFTATSTMSDFDEVMAEATKRDYYIRIKKASGS